MVTCLSPAPCYRVCCSPEGSHWLRHPRTPLTDEQRDALTELVTLADAERHEDASALAAWLNG